MSPTLLEVTVAVLLLWVAWQIGLRIAPLVLRYLQKNLRFREAHPVDFVERGEKNMTPRGAAQAEPSSHGHSTQ